MSKENAEGQSLGEGERHDQGLDPKTNENDLNTAGDLDSKLKEMQSKLERLEYENKKKSERIREQTRLEEERQRELLTKEGKTEELLKLNEEKFSKLSEEYNQLKSKTIRANVTAEVAKLAKDCLDPEDVVNYKQFWEELEVDTDSLSVSGMEKALSKIRQAKPHWFGNRNPGMANAAPANNPPKATSYEEEIKAARTQKEFDAIRKKYGKTY